MSNKLFLKHIVLIVFIVVVSILTESLYAVDSIRWLPVEKDIPITAPEAILLEEASDHLLIKWTVSGVFIQDIAKDKVVYQRIYFKNESLISLSQPGEPLIPSLNETIHIPDNHSVSASIDDIEWITLGDKNLYPRQLPRRDNKPQSIFLKSNAAYSSTEQFPMDNVIIGRIQGWGGVAVAPVTITPFRYYPAEKKLEIARTIIVRVDFHPGHPHNIIKPHHTNRKINNIHKKLILNPPAFVPRELDFDENEPMRMLVIIKEEALETAQPLIDFHHNTGVRTEVWLADEIDGTREIKERVTEMYEEGLEYLFIIGDGYGNNPDIPMFYWDPRDPGWQDEVSTATNSDHWYVCLDPPDDEGYEDHLPELAVCRLVYDSGDDIEELEIQVNKLLDYMEWNYEDDEADWLSRAVLVAHRENDNDFGGRHYINCKRAIEEFDYEKPHPEFITYYGTEEGATNAAIIETINEDGVGIFNYRGHGRNDEWSSWASGQTWRSSQVRQLENPDKPFVLVSNACRTGNIATFGGDCLIESFQKHNGGSLCAFGSVISTYTLSNHFFDEAIFRTWFDDGIYEIGYAHFATQTEMVLHWVNNDYEVRGRMNARAYIWLGDPLLEIRLEPPTEMTVEIPEFARLGTDRIEAVITINGEALEGARLCIRNDDDDIYLVGISNDEGRVVLDFDPPLNDPVQLDWMAYHRLGLPISGEILALDGTGTIEGTVTDLAEEAPLEDAVINFSRFNLDIFTDADGRYRLENVPAEEYTLSVSAHGYLPQSVEVTVEDDSTEIVNFALYFSRLEADSLEINMHLEEDESAERQFTFTNTGNGTFEWSASLNFGDDLEPYQVLDEYWASEETGDWRLNGVELIDDLFFVAGGNRNADPNYIYVIERQGGGVIDQFNQPDECEGIGIYDLAWDGEYLYGSSNETIFQLDIEGNVISSFEGPYDPNIALTADSEGYLWVGCNDQPLVKIDVEGNVLESIPNNLAIRALAWHPLADSGFNLMALILDEDDSVNLYKINPQTGEVGFEVNLAESNDETTGNSLAVSPDFDSGGLTLIGMIDIEDEKFIQLWHLSGYSGWLTIDPEAGSVEPDEDNVIDLIFNAFQFSDGLHLETELLIENNSAENVIEIPVVFEIGEQSNIDDKQGSLPVDFAIANPYPNPFNARTVIPFNIPVTGEMTVTVYDITGRFQTELASGRYTEGQHFITLSADELPSGIYFITFSYSGSILTRKVVLLR
ncbi:MAG: C25 family cysteine peptidase [Candidatus Hatepunaea meridiana]|nr:C25 family cysteine peptidase [Candidatus Hatepunaea meridiana]